MHTKALATAETQFPTSICREVRFDGHDRRACPRTRDSPRGEMGGGGRSAKSSAKTRFFPPACGLINGKCKSHLSTTRRRPLLLKKNSLSSTHVVLTLSPAVL